MKNGQFKKEFPLTELDSDHRHSLSSKENQMIFFLLIAQKQAQKANSSFYFDSTLFYDFGFSLAKI